MSKLKPTEINREELIISRKEWSKAPRVTVLPKRLRTYKSALDLVRKGPLMTSENRYSKVTRIEAKMQWFKKGDRWLRSKI